MAISIVVALDMLGRPPEDLHYLDVMPLAIQACDVNDGPTVAAVHTSTITPFMKYQ